MPVTSRVALAVVLATSGALALALPDTVGVAVAAQLLSAAACVPAGVLCRRVAGVTEGRWATGWRLLAAASPLWVAGNVVTVVSVALPGRGINALIYPLQAAAMLLVVSALLVLPRPRPVRRGVSRAGLDALVLVGSLAVSASVTLVEEAVAHSTGADRVFAFVYPAAGLTMLGLAYGLVRRHVYPPRPELALLSAAFATWLLAGSAYALVPTPLVAPAWVSWALTVGFVLLALAARRALHRDDASPEVGSRVSRAVLVAPDVAVVVAVLAVVLVGLSHWSQQLLAGAVALVVVGRHLLATSDARRFHWRLEREVAGHTAELRDWTERYAGILDTVGDGIVSTDADDRIVFANASARALLGATTAQEWVGRDACETLCVPRDEGCVAGRSPIGEAVAGVRTELRHRSGALVPVELSVAPRPSEDGEPSGVVIVFRDVSAQVALEQVKRQFVSSVSHELRTPLTSVRGVLEMFLDGDAGELSPVGHTLVANASRGVERLSRLVDDIIDAEKLATGRFRMERTRLAVDDVLRDTLAVLEPLAAAEDVVLELDAVTDTVVWGDADRVEQAVVNLVGNAVKFSPPGGVVRVAAASGPGEVVVTVRDEGPGLPADQLEHVFERFHQVSGSGAAEKGGTGLGLTITRAIVEQHGGRIWVESVPGEGALFGFTLPVATEAPGADG